MLHFDSEALATIARGWYPGWIDYDNDGDMDLFIAVDKDRGNAILSQ